MKKALIIVFTVAVLVFALVSAASQPVGASVAGDLQTSILSTMH